jgi:hypothetical protein
LNSSAQAAKKRSKPPGTHTTTTVGLSFPTALGAWGNSFGKIDDVTPSPTEQLSAAIYLDFTGFDQKCFIGRTMQVWRRNVAGRSGNPQHTKGVTRLLGTNQNMCFLAKRS